jgi:hypothetical protein
LEESPKHPADDLDQGAAVHGVPVRRIDRRGPDANQDAVFGDVRFINLPEMKDIGGSRTLLDDCLRRGANLSRRNALSLLPQPTWSLGDHRETSWKKPGGIRG